MKNSFKLDPLSGALPYDLLLLADETKKAIHKYIFNCEVFTLNINNETIGVVAVEQLNSTTAEIKNIAVKTNCQKRGFGKRMIQWLKAYCHGKGIQEIIVGTGDASIYQLLFYQKCGFEVNTIRKNFFIENYDEPIYENGVRLKHMVVLKLGLEKKPG